jgi:hypothetical protein
MNLHPPTKIPTVPKSNIKIVERDKIESLTHTYMTIDIPDCTGGTLIKSGEFD